MKYLKKIRLDLTGKIGMSLMALVFSFFVTTFSLQGWYFIAVFYGIFVLVITAILLSMYYEN